MLDKKKILGIFLCMGIAILGMTETFADTLGIVTTSRLNVRSGPSTSYRVVDKVVRNEKVTILESNNGWHKIKLHDGKIGWSSSKYINSNGSENNTPTEKPDNMSKEAVVTTSRLNVRSGPSTSYQVVGSVYRNNKVTVLQSSNGWYKIKLSNGQIGWSSGKYISFDVAGSGGSGGTVEPGKTMTVEATAYTGYSTTSTGQKPVWGTIAVDPRVIPYGTRVYIPRFDQVFVANNTGGAIKGNKIDIYMDSRSDCYEWGRRTIEIQILGK